MTAEEELQQEITRWRRIQQRLSDIGAYDAVTGAPVLPGGQLPQEDVLALIDPVQIRLDDLAWQAVEEQSVRTSPNAEPFAT